ncbi:MAG: DNA topoisomerase IB [Ferruginibacter sp.]|nr:DNA topoisomerase IB [Ferruginibacter sp.]
MVQLSHNKYVQLVNDYAAAAATVNLVYVNDRDPGIERIKRGKNFQYNLGQRRVVEKKEIERIKKLAIPPAWDRVWICEKQNGHIQATGYDIRQRKQYRYHALWNLVRSETKFHKLLEFGKVLPLLRLQVEKDLGLKELSDRKVIALVISLMERTYIRIGNATYEKMNGSHGITTLHDKHVSVEGDKISFSFKGKKSIHHDISLKNKRLAKVIQQCRDIPGKELFQYYDAANQRKSIDSGMVNAYIHEVTGDVFTAKDFRTWAGCLHLLLAFKNMDVAENITVCKKNINEALDYVSQHLGNTRLVCKKYYVHPGIIRLYEENKLSKYLEELDNIERDDNISGLTKVENVLMKLLGRL